MKRLSLLFLAGAFLAACSNNKSKETVTIPSEDGKESISVNVKEMQDAAQNMEKMKEDLGKLTPLSLEELKKLIPEVLMGGKRTRYDVSSSAGAGMATGEYEINDSISVSLHIYDCAGPGGAGIYSMQYLGMLNLQQESDEEYTKTVEINGNKGFEHCEKATNDCSISFFTGGRFLVSLEGNHVGAPALKQAAGELKVK